MGILKQFFNQTRRPEGFLGKVMLRGMNPGHAKLADWERILVWEKKSSA